MTSFFEFIVFFTDTATNDIYTYSHTLALHDSLPSCRLQAATGDCDGARRSFGQATQLDPALFDAWSLLGVTYMREERQAQALPFLRQAHQLRPTHPDRSEEHTSELQSLMRITYAVFCLKHNNTHTHKQ